jgi:6-phosphogluconolactonase
MGENPGRHYRLLIGTYTRGTSRGIYSATLDRATGVLGAPELEAEAPNPTFIALSPDRRHLYAVCAGPGWLSSFRVDPASPRLVPVQISTADASPTPCHVAVDVTGKIALAANYHLGKAAAVPLNPDGTFGTPRVVTHSGHGPHPTAQTSPHVHSTNITRNNRFALVCDLGLDQIYTYAIDPKAVELVQGTPPYIPSAPGAGPRHLAFNADGGLAYVINELDATVAVYGCDPSSARLTHLQTVSVLPAGHTGAFTAAEVKIHPGGRFLYASCRGPDTLGLFAVDGASGLLSLVEFVPCGGKGPRNFAVSPDGEWLVCAHQGSDTLCVFKIDPGSGRLKRIEGTIPVSMPVCVLFLD